VDASLFAARRLIVLVHREPAFFGSFEFLDRVGAFLRHRGAFFRVMHEEERIGQRRVELFDFRRQGRDVMLGGIDLVFQRLQPPPFFRCVAPRIFFGLLRFGGERFRGCVRVSRKRR